MVITSLIKNILPIAGVGLALAFLYNVVAKPGSASASAGALGQTLDALGGGLGSVGVGAQSFLTGIGTGSARLLDPLFSLKTLVYGDNTQQIVKQENLQTASNTTLNDPVVNASSTQVAVSPDPAAQTIGPQVSEMGVVNPAQKQDPISPYNDYIFLDSGGGGSKDPTSPNWGGTQQERIALLIKKGYGNDVVSQWNSGLSFGSLEYIFNTGEEPSNPAAINSIGGNSVVLTDVPDGFRPVSPGSIYQGPIYPDYSNPDY